MDVVRKILIISRLIGLNLEISDIDNKKFISNECLNSNDENDFFKHLENCQESLQNMKNNAIKNNKIIKHVAVIENKKVSVSLKEFDCSHPFNSLDGSDNMLIITSNNYNENKLIIRGPGAGASVTAAGIISDVYLSL
jgi:aspartokinase/homoserine dehydrogenase 1